MRVRVAAGLAVLGLALTGCSVENSTAPAPPAGPPLRIAFESNRPPSTVGGDDIYFYDAASGAPAAFALNVNTVSTEYIPALSGDGRSVAFTTQDDGLSDEDTSGAFPILVRDLRRHRTIYVSRASGARGAGADASSYEPALSGDGRVVAFHSDATNLDPADRGGRPDVYARDLRTHRTVLVSRAHL